MERSLGTTPEAHEVGPIELAAEDLIADTVADCILIVSTMRSSVFHALLAAVLFGASTPVAKLLIGELSPILLGGLLYLGSGVGLAVACGVCLQLFEGICMGRRRSARSTSPEYRLCSNRARHTTPGIEQVSFGIAAMKQHS